MIYLRIVSMCLFPLFGFLCGGTWHGDNLSWPSAQERKSVAIMGEALAVSRPDTFFFSRSWKNPGDKSQLLGWRQEGKRETNGQDRTTSFVSLGAFNISIQSLDSLAVISMKRGLLPIYRLLRPDGNPDINKRKEGRLMTRRGFDSPLRFLFIPLSIENRKTVYQMLFIYPNKYALHARRWRPRMKNGRPMYRHTRSPIHNLRSNFNTALPNSNFQAQN